MDGLILALDKALRVTAGISTHRRPNPAEKSIDIPLKEDERKRSAGLMRVNHVGEVCAQALYDAQSCFSKNAATRQQFIAAGKEEEDHLAWTAQRLHELGSRPSLLNPVWYGASYALGAIAGRLGDAKSLGFVVETERQVEAHLAEHLRKLPESDFKSRAIVEQMRADEVAHGHAAAALGAADLPEPVKQLMRAMAKVMTTTAYYF